MPNIHPPAAPGPESPDIPPHIACVLEMITDGFVAIDSQDCYIYVNRHAERMLARSRKALLGANLWAVFPAEADSPFRQALSRARSENIPVTCENFAPTFGTWIENHIYPSSDGLMFVYFRDVTARKKAEAERDEMLRLAQQRTAELEAVIEHIPAGVYVGNRDGVSACNDQALSILGFGNAEEFRRAVPELSRITQTRDPATGEPMPPERHPFLRALAGETSTEKMLVRHVLTGNDSVVRCVSAPIWEDDQVVAAIAIKIDITEEWLRSERERKAALAQDIAQTARQTTRTEGLTIRSRCEGDRLWIEAEGTVTVGTANTLGEALRAGAEAGALHVTVDLRRVETLDAAGLAQLVEASKRLRSAEVPLAPRIVVTPGRQPARVLHMGAFYRIMEIVTDDGGASD